MANDIAVQRRTTEGAQRPTWSPATAASWLTLSSKARRTSPGPQPSVGQENGLFARGSRFLTKPKTFFRPDGDLPDAVSISFDLPRGPRELPHAEFAQRLQERITAVEREAAAERARTGRRIVGRRGLLDQHWGDSPRSRESRRQLPPRVACQNLWRRIETLGRNKAWIEACREARAAFLAGAKACFPAGTFWLKRHASVACEPFPSD